MKHLGGVWETLKAPGPRLRSSERGVTGLETAIILIAFVVVASVFAFTVLSTGIFSAERGKETVFAALRQARDSVELKGSIIANGVKDVHLSDNDTIWNAQSNVTLTLETTDKKVGSGSSKFVVATAFSTGLVAYEDLTIVQDMTNRDSISIWIKSSVGFEPRCLARADGLCETVIETGRFVHRYDARQHPVAKLHPLVDTDTGIVFYAGAPVRDAEGRVLGTFCIADHHPRAFSEREQQSLQDFADWVVDLIQLMGNGNA